MFFYCCVQVSTDEAGHLQVVSSQYVLCFSSQNLACAQETAKAVLDYWGLDASDPGYEACMNFDCFCQHYHGTDTTTHDLSLDVHVPGSGHVWRWGC